jgi:hypothetical protein
MSTSGMIEAIYEEPDARTAIERGREAYEQAISRVEPEDVLLVLCDTLREEKYEGLMDLITEQLDDPEWPYEPRVHPDEAKRLYRRLIALTRKIISELATLHLYAEGEA